MPLSKKRNKERMRKARATYVQPKVVQPEAQGVVQPKQETLEKLRGVIKGLEAPSRLHKEDVQPKLPIYNPAIHKPGDKVRVPRYKGKGFNVIMVPELDGDGHEIPWRDYV